MRERERGEVGSEWKNIETGHKHLGFVLAGGKKHSCKHTERFKFLEGERRGEETERAGLIWPM